MSHESYLHVFEFEISRRFHLQIFHWFIARLRSDISKVTAHERIQHLYREKGQTFLM
jgi:hypothetical protein